LRCKEQKDIDDGGMDKNGVEVDGATFIWEGKRVIPDEDLPTHSEQEKDGEGDEEVQQATEDEFEVYLLQQQLREAESHIRELMNRSAIANQIKGGDNSNNNANIR
jgi:hypothetical protein